MTTRRAPKRAAGTRKMGGEAQVKPTGKSIVSRGQYKQGSDKWIEAMERSKKALELRKAGMSYQQIADACGYTNKGTAMRAVVRMLEHSAGEVAEHVRRLEAARLDTMFAAIYPRAIRGELLAVDRAIRIMERRAAMLGTDAPIRIQQMVITEEQMLEAIEHIEAEAKLLADAGGGWEDDDNIVEAEIVDIHGGDDEAD